MARKTKAKAKKRSAPKFTLKSPNFKANGLIGMAHVFNSFGCTGKNLSPALSWSNAPAGTKSFALLCHDPDAPTGGAGWWHWLVLNIPSTADHLPLDAGNADGTSLPDGAVQVATDFGAPGYGGPCPPPGDKPHRYVFTLYALKVDKLDAGGGTASLAGYMVNGNAIGKATLVGRFGRRK